MIIMDSDLMYKEFRRFGPVRQCDNLPTYVFKELCKPGDPETYILVVEVDGKLVPWWRTQLKEGCTMEQALDVTDLEDKIILELMGEPE